MKKIEYQTIKISATTEDGKVLDSFEIKLRKDIEELDVNVSGMATWPNLYHDAYTFNLTDKKV